MAKVYRHIRLDKNEPFYIGVASSYKRATSRRGRNNIWHKIVSKTDYEIEIILDGVNRDQALEKEVEFIKLYGRIDLKTGTLCNLTDGGEGCCNQIISDESRLKTSIKLKGRKLSNDHKLKISNSHNGKKMSYEHKQKLMEGCRKNHNDIVEKSRIANNKKVVDLKTGTIYSLQLMHQ